MASDVGSRPLDKTDDLKVDVMYLTLAGYGTNGNTCADKPGTPWSSAIPTGGAAKCVKLSGFAIPIKHVAKIDLHLEFRPQDTDGWPTSPDAKINFRAGFSFGETTTVTFPAVPTVRTSNMSFGLVGVGKKVTAGGGFLYDSVGGGLAGRNVRLFNTPPVMGTACGLFASSGAVGGDTTQADGFWFIWRTGNNQSDASAPLLPDGVKYTAVVCHAGLETMRVTLVNKLGNNEFIELDLR